MRRFLILILILTACTPQAIVPLASPAAGRFYRTFTPGDPIVVEVSGSGEKISVVNNAWSITAGGYPASTHYARIRHKIPESEGLAPTYFYMRSVIVLPSDFYIKQTAGFRILNTDNFGTTLNGKHVGAVGVDEFRTGVWFYTDHTLRIRTAQDSGAGSKVFFTLPFRLPVGEHTIEFAGDVANVAPWYLRIDGETVASGTARLSPDTVPPAERVITRLTAGIMGAAELDNNSATYLIREFAVANYDVSVPATSTPTITPTKTVHPSSTPTPTPTFECLLFPAHDQTVCLP